jgi:nitroreductase
VAAQAKGLSPRVDYADRPFAERDQAECIATITLKDGAQPDALVEQIPHRTTNRRPYQAKALASADRDALSGEAQARDTAVHWLTDRSAIAHAARCVQQSDRIRFEQQAFHEELQRSLRLDAGNEPPEEGMSLKALEIPGLMKPVLQSLRPWRRMRQANRAGASWLFSQMAAGAVKRSGALAMLTTRDASDAGYLEAGRAMQRFWLKATELGLAVQPLGSLPLFLLKQAIEPAAFTEPHRQTLNELEPTVRSLFGLTAGETPVMLLRLGQAAPPSGQNGRFPLAHILLEEAL